MRWDDVWAPVLRAERVKLADLICQYVIMSVRRTDTPTEYHRLGYTRLFRDDLEKIAILVAEVGQLSIVCDNLEATTASDFSNPLMPERPKYISMEASNGEQRIRIEVGRGTGKLTIEEPNTLTEGIRTKIEGICDGGFIDHMIAGPNVNLWGIAGFVPVGCALALGLSKAISLSTSEFGMLIGTLVWVAAGSFIFRFREKSDIVIINVNRADRPSFFRRTKDEWIVELSVMIIGLILGYLIGRLTK